MTSGNDHLSGHELHQLRSVYFGLHIAGGHIGLPLLVLTFFFSKHVHRPLTVINFCIAWIIYSISYSLLLYGGNEHPLRDPPPFALCLTQAAMIHGTPPMAAVAGLGVVVQAYTTYQLPWQYWSPSWIIKLPGWVIALAIVIPPYLAFLPFAITAAFLGMNHPEDLSATQHLRVHCTLTNQTGPFERFAVPAFCAGISAIIVVLEISAICKYYRGWLKIKQVFPLATRRPSLSPWFRVSVFTLYSLAVLGSCISYLSQHINPATDMIQAALPLVATIIFATQTDVMSVWAFWRCKQRREVMQNPDFVPGGGWSRPTSQEVSPQYTGHLSLSSNA